MPPCQDARHGLRPSLFLRPPLGSRRIVDHLQQILEPHVQGTPDVFDGRECHVVAEPAANRSKRWLNECRRVATRFEKLAVNFLAMLKLAIIEQYLRYDFSDRA